MSRTELGRYVLQYPIPFLLFLLCVYVLYLLLLVRPCLLRVAASLETKPCTWLFVSQSFLSNIREPSRFLDVLMFAATFPRSALLPALSPSSNLVVSYCLISSVNRTAWLRGLCKAQPSCKSLQEAEASFLSRCSSVCATSALPISSLFSTVGNFSAQPLLSLSVYTVSEPLRSWRCSPTSRWLSRSLNFLNRHHLTSSLRAQEEIAALFLITWRSLMDSSLLDWKKVYIYNKICWTLGPYDRVLVGNDYTLPHAISSPNPNSV